MPAIGRIASDAVIEKLAHPVEGVGTALAALMGAEGAGDGAIGVAEIQGHNISFDLAERSTGASYPTAYVYCEAINNELKEKFRTFSGAAQMAVEVRVSQDRFEGLAEEVQLYTEAITTVLDRSRGQWGGGLFFGGRYRVEYGPVKRGGKGFLQTAKVRFEVEASL